LLRQGKSWMQVPCAGHEGLMAFACQLRATDYLFSYYRGYHLRLAKGISAEQLAKDFLARRGSSSGGRSMSVHCSSRELNVFPDAGPVASQCLPAVGVAWGQKLNRCDDLTVCSLGEGATRQGEFYEAVCFAIQEHLPIVFLVEDNKYAISTRTEKMTPLRLEMLNKAYVQIANGYDVDEMYEVGRKAIERIRAGLGPAILWCHVDRVGSHTLMDDHRRYRSDEELAALTDPIEHWCEKLIAAGQITPAEIATLRQEIAEEIESTYARVEREPALEVRCVYDHVFAATETSKAETAPVSIPLRQEKSTTTLLAAFNQTLRNGLAELPKMMILGQDIQDPKGGVFGLTAGLSTEFPQRVINTPIAEATILGTAVGLGLLGYKPVCEIQFIDFISPGFNQLTTHIGTLNWRSVGRWPCPIVIYAPYGAYLPAGGLWHSESKEGWWTHIPGLRVAVPSRPEDAAGLLASALHEDVPTLLLLPKHLFRLERHCQTSTTRIPFGQARIVREGREVTVVAWGNCVELAEAAAEEVDEEGCSVEIIDLRTLVPCDWETIDQSLKKTGRLVVVHEDSRTSGFGATLVAEMLAHAKRFEYLIAAPQLVTRADVPIPYHPDMERSVLPSCKDLIDAIKTVYPAESLESMTWKDRWQRQQA